MSDHLNVADAAALLQVHPNTVRNWVRSGYLTDVRLPGTKWAKLDRRELEVIRLGRAKPRRPVAEVVASDDRVALIDSVEEHLVLWREQDPRMVAGTLVDLILQWTKKEDGDE